MSDYKLAAQHLHQSATHLQDFIDGACQEIARLQAQVGEAGNTLRSFAMAIDALELAGLDVTHIAIASVRKDQH